jgi:hypothetical protein
MGQHFWDQKCWLFCGQHVQWLQWCPSRDCDALQKFDWVWIDLHSDLGVTPIQLRWCTWTTKVFLEFGSLAMG